MATARPRVVYIEDEPDMLALVRLILGSKGYEVIGANSGQEGLQLIVRVKPALVLLDLMMPDMDGWQVIEHIKANPTISHIPVIVVTAKAQSIDKAMALNIAKVEDYVVKPFEPAQLLESVSRVLARTS